MDTPPPLDTAKSLKQRFLTWFLLFTAPGVMLHELAHQLICIWQRIPLGEVVYFQLDTPAGYVKHGNPRSWKQAFLLAVAPLFINILTAMWLFLFAFSTLTGGITIAALGGVLTWLGFGAAIHCLPSPQDIKNLWEYTTAHVIRYPLIVLVGPLYGIIILVYKFGMFYVTIPIATTLLAVTFVILQIDPVMVLECLSNGQWGCWDSRSFLDLITTRKQ